MIVIGIDPDSEAHGVAVYVAGELFEIADLANGKVEAYKMSVVLKGKL